MRIAHIITRMIVGGAQENTLLTCEDLIRMYGDDVMLITGPAIGPEGDLLSRGRGDSVPRTIVPSLRRAIHPWRDIASYRSLKEVLRDLRPDIVHTHSAKGGFLGRLAATAVGVPAIVHTVHGAPFHEFQGRGARMLFQTCERYAAGKCHAMISVADAMTDLMLNARVGRPGQYRTIYSGMDVEPFLNADCTRAATRRELGFEEHHVIIGKIARLFHLKGHEFLIEAAADVVRGNPNVRFLLVGDGILRDTLLEQIGRAGLTNHFHFTGLVPPERIPTLVGAMDLLVHCSLREGLARALPQALIAGKPVVSYDVDGAREVVIPDQTGFLLPPRSVPPLAAALLELACDSSLRRKLGATGRERFTDRFRHETMTREIRMIYERLLKERAHGPASD